MFGLPAPKYDLTDPDTSSPLVRLVQRLIGMAVIALLVGLLLVVATGSKQRGQLGLTAYFSDVGELTAGSPVRVKGVVVGKVTSIRLSHGLLKVETRMQVDSALSLRQDSSAAIVTSSLLGGVHINLDTGQSEEPLGPDKILTRTYDALRLDQLLERILSAGISAELARINSPQPQTGTDSLNPPANQR